MDFNSFLNAVPKIVNHNLLGEFAHQIMSPPQRKKLMANFDRDASKKAAVLLLLYPKDGIMHIVLILRTSYNGVHSSQVAFPGGKAEKFDLNFQLTALRETYEEIGIDATLIEVIKPLSEVDIPPSNFLVFPFLGFATSDLTFEIDPKEVAGIIEFPVQDLLDDANVITQLIPTSYLEPMEVPCFQVNEYKVWGATAMILSELKEMLKKVL